MGSSKKGKRKRPQPVSPPAGQPAARSESTRQVRRQRAIEGREAKRRQNLLIGGVLLAAFLAFANSLDGEFVYDDRLQVLKNPTVKSLSNIPMMMTKSVWQFMNQGAAGAVGPYYRPLFNVILIINYQMFEFSVFGWHLVSVLLHVGVTLLIYLLARRFGLSAQAGLVGALLFAVHPVHSESVAWVSGIPDPMAALFIILSMLAYERHRETPLAGWKLPGLSAAFAFLALLSKETAIALPVFFVVSELLDRVEGESFGALAARTLKRTAPFFAVATVYLVLRYLVLGFLRQDDPNSAGIPSIQVLLTIPSILLTYIRLLLLPYPLAVVYDHTYVQSASDPRFWGSALGVAAILGGAIWLVRRSPIGRRALALTIIFILPVLNLKAFRLEESLLHDRYLYLPSIGFSILLATGFGWAIERWGERTRTVAVSAVVVVAGVLFVLTLAQNRTWQSENAMAGHALELFPRWPFLHNYVGAQRSLAGRWGEAEQSYLEAIKYQSNYSDAWSNLGDVYRETKRLAEAEQAYIKSIDYGAPYADTRYNLGVTYTSMNRFPEAESALLAALQMQPDHSKASYNLGWVYGTMNRDAEAEQAYLKTIELDPAYPEPRINLAVILTKQRRFDEAIYQLLTARTLVPDHPVMLYALGDAYRQANRFNDAITAFNQLQSRQPQHHLVYTSLGLCYEGLGNKGQARANFERAISTSPNEQWTNVAREHLAKL